jgi:hypothetical protein
VWGFNRLVNPVPLLAGTSAVGARWESASSSWGNGYTTLPLVSGQLFQGAAWINVSVLFPAQPAAPVVWYVGTVPAGLGPAGNLLTRIVMGSGQAAQQAPYEQTGRFLRFGWPGALPAGPYDWWINWSSAALPAGSTTVSISAIPAQTL